MSYGLVINNRRGTEVFNSSSLPYRFTVYGERMDEIRASGNNYIYRKDVHGRVTPEVIASIEMPEGIKGNYVFRLVSGRWYIYYAKDTIRTEVPRMSSPPRFWLIDRIAPSTPASSFGIETRDTNNLITFNSDSPLARINAMGKVTIAPNKWTTYIAPSAGNVLILHQSGGIERPSSGDIWFDYTVRDIWISKGAFYITSFYSYEDRYGGYGSSVETGDINYTLISKQ